MSSRIGLLFLLTLRCSSICSYTQHFLTRGLFPIYQDALELLAGVAGEARQEVTHIAFRGQVGQDL